jgi:nucleoside-diphosphate-sugar epimerase
MKFLVTGGAGFLGINLVRYLLNKNHSVVSLDIAPFDYEDCMDKIEIITGDIRDSELLNKSFAISSSIAQPRCHSIQKKISIRQI